MSDLPSRIDATPGGIAATLLDSRASQELEYDVAATDGPGFNTIRQRLEPDGCFRLDSHRFEVGSSFIGPNSVNEFAILARIRPPNAPRARASRLAVFGHADSTGSDADNKALSGRRAMSVYAMLTRDVAIWERLHDSPAGSDRWGPRVLRMMLAVCGFGSGVARDEMTPAAREAARKFQSAQGLRPTGDVDRPTRKRLFRLYMDTICVDEAGAPLVYRPEDFLGRGEDPQGKASYQGCSEFNPIVVPSAKRMAFLSKRENKALRDAELQNNRRVVIYMFPPRVKFPVANWPCPRASEGGGACSKQFWRNGDERRKPGERHREHERHDGTFSCRFYDSFARFSPAEFTRRDLNVWLLDHLGARMPAVPFQALLQGMRTEGNADGQGRAVLREVFTGAVVELAWGRVPGGKATEWLYRTELVVDTDDQPRDDEAHAAVRLHNLGYRHGSFDERLNAFQRDHGLASAPWPDEATRDALFAAHATGELRRAEQGSGANEARYEVLGNDLLIETEW
jgi:outer membrane protein OmpA-like peptidoglycan-associated protein